MKHGYRAALAALFLALPAARPAHAQPAGSVPVQPARPAQSGQPVHAQPAGSTTVQPLRPVRVGSFEVLVETNYFTKQDVSGASVRPRGETGANAMGQILWRCADGGGVWAGVILSGTGRNGDTRPAEWRFDDDAPATAALQGVTHYRRWFLPPEEVVRFTQRARSARSLVIRVPGDGAEYVYDLDQPGEALDQLPCTRGTLVAGRIPQTDTAFSGQGRAGAVVPNTEGTYEIPASAPPRIRDEAELARLVSESIPGRLRRSGISGRVTLRFRARSEGAVEAVPRTGLVADEQRVALRPLDCRVHRVSANPVQQRRRVLPGRSAARHAQV